MLLQSVKMAVSSILSNKMRTFLTMLGMIIGVVSLVVLVSTVNGATDQVTDSIQAMGTNLLTVQIQDDKENPFTVDEVMELTDLDSVAETAVLSQGNGTAKRARNSESITMCWRDRFIKRISFYGDRCVRGGRQYGGKCF